MFGKLSNDAIEKHLGTLQTIAQKELGPKAQEIIQDDAKMSIAFKTLYPALPFPVKLVIKEDKFIEFALANRYRLLPGATS
jgi:hypothetical protein